MAKTNKKNDKTTPEEDVAPDVTAELPGEEPPAEQPAPTEENLAAQLEVERDKYVRLYAEYDNYRKRSQKEREALYATVRAETLLRILPVYDNLERALKQECTDEAFQKGVEMTMTQLCEILENMGVTPIKSVGETFDPAVHNAVFNMQDENYGEKEIVEETQKGFMIGDRVIRFASVVVAN